jgi:hypothetical protein
MSMSFEVLTSDFTDEDAPKSEAGRRIRDMKRSVCNEYRVDPETLGSITEALASLFW